MTVDMIGAYSASKYAVEAVSDAFRGELAHWGIKVSVIEPGGTRRDASSAVCVCVACAACVACVVY